MSRCLKGLFTNFEYITLFSCPTKRNSFCKRSISMKQLWLEIIKKIECSKSSVLYIIYITVLGRTDFVHLIFSIISSQSCFIEMDLSQKMCILLGHEKNFIYSKLLNNPFKLSRTDFERHVIGSPGCLLFTKKCFYLKFMSNPFKERIQR